MPVALEVDARPLRRWQIDALADYEARQPANYLATATPGAGKTTFALTVAERLLRRRIIRRVIVVAPTDHLRTQWAKAAGEFGIVLDPNVGNDNNRLRADADGYVTTYAQVAAHPMRHYGRASAVSTLVILDEIHHAGDGHTWGEAISEAFDPATRRLALTGTPFRTNPQERIPFVAYETNGDGELESQADFSYGYADALGDSVVRPVYFAAYSGVSRWMDSAGQMLSANLSEPLTKAMEEAAWRTALDPEGDWVRHVIAAVDDRITHLRANGVPDAGGLLLASDQEAARAYAKIVKKVTGHTPVVILSDDPKASKKITAFAEGDARIAVCVRMVSEGVDIPRVCVLGFLTSYRTPLFFAQAVGRVVRARARHEAATVFLPAVRPLLTLAAELEEQRTHVLRSAQVADEREQPDIELGKAGSITAIGAEAEFAHLLHSGRAITATLSADEEDFLGIPGLLTPEQTAALLASREEELRRRARQQSAEADDDPDSVDSVQSWEQAQLIRRHINVLVSAHAAASGRSHADLHAELRRAVPGPSSASASVELLERRRAHLQQM